MAESSDTEPSVGNVSTGDFHKGTASHLRARKTGETLGRANARCAFFSFFTSDPEAFLICSYR